MEKKLFGILDTGAEIYEYTLKNEDAEVSIITYGGAIRKFTVFGTDIVGGYDTLDAYIADDSHQGGIIGRVANRVGGASFTMDGKLYPLPKNDGENCLHGGEGFDRRVWSLAEYSEADKPENYGKESITLTYVSKDGEEGFPAELAIAVCYTLHGTALGISYVAIPCGKTPISLTNHAYFNLNGLGGNVLSHEIEIFADSYTSVGEDLIPDGNRPSVSGTAMDFLTPHAIGERIGEVAGGYDHNYILSPSEYINLGNIKLGLAARVKGDKLMMNVYTDRPGIQFYTGNFLGGAPDFKGGVKRIKHGAFCLETQTEPNAINNGLGFFNEGEIYSHNTLYSIERK